MPTRPNKNEIMGCDIFEDILAFFQASPKNIHFPDVEMDLKDIVGIVEDTRSNLKELVPQSEDLGKTWVNLDSVLLKVDTYLDFRRDFMKGKY